MAVLLRSWRTTVTLVKLVDRSTGLAKRVTAPKALDLTPYLGDAGGVQTTKTIGECAGGFSLEFSDRIAPEIKDSLYALIEPMDLVEIRAAQYPHLFAGQDLPLIMRGFVSTVRRVESIGTEGNPSRTVVVQGQDSGKLWLIHQILFQLGYLTDSPFLSKFQFQATTGMEVAVLPVSDFMRALLDITNQKVAALAAYSSQQLKQFISVATVKQGQVPPELPAQYHGNLWGLAEQFADRPWNEMFIEDRELGPVFIFRPAPFKDALTGKFILADAVDPGTIEVGADSVVSISVARADSNVANLFWVDPGNSSLDTGFMMSTASFQNGEPFDFMHGNNKPELYGVKQMQAASHLLSNDLATVPALAPSGSQVATGEKQVQWYQARARDLKAMNRDNGALEAGELVLRGGEDIKIGRYLKLTRGGVTSESYIVAVSHTLTPLASWTTQASTIRGTGFLERGKIEGSPYWKEGRQGPYSL